MVLATSVAPAPATATATVIATLLVMEMGVRDMIRVLKGSLELIITDEACSGIGIAYGAQFITGQGWGYGIGRLENLYVGEFFE